MGATVNESGATFHWKIHSIEFLNGLESNQDEVKRVILDAFRALGKLFNGEEYFAVEVVFAVTQKQKYRSTK